MSSSNPSIDRVLRALDEIRNGKMVILVDDEDRENEGDLVFAAELVTPEHINFMATHARGLICLAMDDAMIDRLELAPMVRDNQASLGTAFTVSIEARHGVSTGISARDRATTIRAAIADDAGPANIVSPGHVFPLRARKGGVLVRTGQTEGSVDLARLAGLKPAGVICEIMRDDGEMARRPELEEFAAKHGLLLLSVADLIAYRLEREQIVRRRATGAMRPGSLGPGEPFVAHYYDTEVEDTEYLALVRGDVAAVAATGQPVLVRVAAMDPLADSFSLRPDLDAALRAIDDAGCGVLLYVMSRRAMRLGPSFERLVLQRNVARLDPAGGNASAALRDFGLGAQVLADLGCHKVRLMIWSDRRIPGLEGFGIEVVERVPIPGARARVSRGAQ
jgi:3,4-dihydroxy 2-butanone 4-phosphate synthase/GTP cyclohydrolase II|nr:3,4-dihydroxy-2-butanone-4-phosphate synthase [Kofleriaceae bacterium]